MAKIKIHTGEIFTEKDLGIKDLIKEEPHEHPYVSTYKDKQGNVLFHTLEENIEEEVSVENYNKQNWNEEQMKKVENLYDVLTDLSKNHYSGELTKKKIHSLSNDKPEEKAIKGVVELLLLEGENINKIIEIAG